jgi:hypothetical protein
LKEELKGICCLNDYQGSAHCISKKRILLEATVPTTRANKASKSGFPITTNMQDMMLQKIVMQ